MLMHGTKTQDTETMPMLGTLTAAQLNTHIDYVHFCAVLLTHSCLLVVRRVAFACSSSGLVACRVRVLSAQQQQSADGRSYDQAGIPNST